MNKLIDAKTWIDEMFEKDEVTLKKVKKWIKNGYIPGAILGDDVYVDADQAAVVLQINIQKAPNTPQPLKSKKSVADLVQLALEGM